MNILIIGCGRLGSNLANTLQEDGHDVSVLDMHSKNFDLLDDEFDGLTVQGNPIDIDVLKSAGIEGCDSVLAVTEDDNTNIMAAEIAETIFGVKNVVARIIDSTHNKIFDQLGVNTLCPTVLATEAATAYILGTKASEKIVPFGKSSVEFMVFKYDEKLMKGKVLKDMNHYQGLHLLGLLSEDNQLVLYTPDSKTRLIEKTDSLIFGKVIN